ncbi:MAG TPA: DUF3500 domain-containing protein [Rhodothermales bacterium]|nr:DUF3500 domain-containing protein [Rhodothermales bacterium]
MAPTRRRALTTGVLASCVLLIALALTHDLPSLLGNAPGHADMREAAQAFLNTLDAEARARAQFPFDSEERFDWHYIPKERLGLPLADMTLEQRRAAHALMHTALSTQGYLKATSIMRLEDILKQIGDAPATRDPERYYFSVFGTPAGDQPWGWRLEGHHLSLNYSSVTDQLMAVTPEFMGSNPAEVRTGPYSGLRVLAAEEDLARNLLHSLSPTQLKKAVIQTEAPREIITGNSRKVLLTTFDGLPASEMTQAQRDLLLRLIHEYTHNMREDVAQEQDQKIRDAGIEKLYFAWAGGLEHGQPHYYRVHGPTVLFEYDNTQNDANHIHTVWRDLTGDFGEDLLLEHYQHAGPGHGHDH